MEAGVSVIIPTYNRGFILKRAVESVLSQSYKKLEVIIIDDASGDDTEQVVASIDDPRIRYYKLEQNKGTSWARNEGVRLAKYDFVAFQDSDDEWLPQKLEKQMQVLENAPAGTGMVYHPFHNIEKDEIWPQPKTESFYHGNLFELLLYGNVIGGPTILVRKDYFEDVRGFAASQYCLEDYEFVLRFARKYRIEYINEVLLYTHTIDEGVNSHKHNNILGKLYIIDCWKQEMLNCNLGDKNALKYNVDLALAFAHRYGFEDEVVPELDRILSSIENGQQFLPTEENS